MRRLYTVVSAAALVVSEPVTGTLDTLPRNLPSVAMPGRLPMVTVSMSGCFSLGIRPEIASLRYPYFDTHFGIQTRNTPLR